MKRYKVYAPEDLQNFADAENICIEIYAKNKVFEQSEIKGSIYLRGESCTFPNLVSIAGNLSVDAPFCSLEKLEKVQGNCIIHNEVNIDKLKEIKGNLKCIVDLNFKNLEKIGGSIQSKKAKLTTRGHLLRKNRKPVAVNRQYEVDRLPADGIFDVDIFGDNLIFPHTHISGNITVKSQKADFPNLVSLHGNLYGDPREKSKEKCKLNYPSLEQIIGNVELKNTTSVFDSLTFVKGSISMEKSETDFPVLERSGTIRLNSYSSASFPELVEIRGGLTKRSYSSKKYYFPKLKKVNGIFHKNDVEAPFLEEVGELLSNENFEMNFLQKINGSCTISKYFKSNSLRHINILEIKNNVFYSPALESVNHYLYKKEEHYETLAKNIYFRITDQLYISKTSFLISRFGFETGLKGNKYPLKELVRILKLRHSSFQNFETRELKREWTTEDHQEFHKIIEKIRVLWDKTEALSFQEFFTSDNRNFRLFCFNYIGVGTLMKELDARKINAHSIDVDHVEYDINGNRESIKKTNIYEVYEIENQKLGIGSWNSRNGFSYAVKCWCPSTGKEHWLWIEEQYKDNALTAIASTFRVHENMIPYIRCLKRQGDLLFCELIREVTPKGFTRPLTAKEYFSLLEVET
ncbi:hypothetical protein HNP38_003254 [Chryseobacterium defluvii]|uniref:Uncharacterized protein n=1 Tax=Chryseobacterium defluvii TaxID=160396 RepID=A0A840KIT6_9FLAO|nr:hypothetical protein [Chryseobacterium defluvii]MBB4807938.1 hypothetical protein [Chryseobacterium defluvii]